MLLDFAGGAGKGVFFQWDGESEPSSRAFRLRRSAEVALCVSSQGRALSDFHPQGLSMDLLMELSS